MNTFLKKMNMLFPKHPLFFEGSANGVKHTACLIGISSVSRYRYMIIKLWVIENMDMKQTFPLVLPDSYLALWGNGQNKRGVFVAIPLRNT
ncbi:MAG: hypothetical protein K2F69_07410 [Bacteroidaceae bacterium]|nr:hypothetical protein [Bacteroidaceae bacterium]